MITDDCQRYLSAIIRDHEALPMAARAAVAG
jgi:hypothetical protein